MRTACRAVAGARAGGYPTGANGINADHSMGFSNSWPLQIRAGFDERHHVRLARISQPRNFRASHCSGGEGAISTCLKLCLIIVVPGKDRAFCADLKGTMHIRSTEKLGNLTTLALYAPKATLGHGALIVRRYGAPGR